MALLAVAANVAPAAHSERSDAWRLALGGRRSLLQGEHSGPLDFIRYGGVVVVAAAFTALLISNCEREHDRAHTPQQGLRHTPRPYTGIQPQPQHIAAVPRS